MRLRTFVAAVCATLISMGLFGCASVSTSGSLPRVDTYPRAAEHDRSITVRFYAETDYRNQETGETAWVALESKPGFTERVRKVIETSNAFREVKSSVFSSSRIFVQDPKDPFLQKVRGEDLKHIDTDYFLDIVDRFEGNPYAVSWGTPLCVLSIFTFGLLPCPKPAPMNLEAVLYDARGQVVEKVSVQDKAVVWAWSPLFLLPGKTFFPDSRDVTAEFVLKGVANIQQKLITITSK